jgi:hypothetical protein
MRVAAEDNAGRKEERPVIQFTCQKSRVAAILCVHKSNVAAVKQDD